MNGKEYLDRKLYRVPMTVMAIIACGMVLLNLPYERMQRRVWTGQVIESRAHRQLDSLRDNVSVPINKQGWERDQSFGRVAGWPEAIVIAPAPAGTARELWSALKHNSLKLMTMAALATVLVFAVQWMIFSLIAILKRVFNWRHALIVSSILVSFTGTTVGCHRIVVSGIDPDLEIADRGALSFSTCLPAVLASIMPESMSRPFLRAESALACGLRPALIDRLVSQSSMNRMVLKDCLINRHQWQQLVGHPSLKQLRFERCHFEPSSSGDAVVQWQVSDLLFADCTGLENISGELPHAKTLRRCMIQGRAESLHSLTSAIHRGTLEHLELVISADKLSPSRAGDMGLETEPSAVTLELDAFQQLQSLSLFDLTGSSSRASTALSVSNCPQLNRITVDHSRAWDLKLAHLPRLTELNGHSDHPGRFRSSGSFLATIRSLSISDVPCINKLALHSAKLEAIHVEACPGLQELVMRGEQNHFRLDRSSYSRDRAVAAPSGRNLANHFSNIFSEQSWLHQLRFIDLSHNSLSDVDLSSLTQLKKLKKLHLDHTDIEVEQLTSTGTNEVLQHLSFSRHQLSSADLITLLDCYPKLRTTRFYPSHIDELIVVDRPELESLGLGPDISAPSVQIVNCPKLSDSLHFTQPMTKLHIQDAPSLQSLTVDQPVPADTVLEGLRHLKQLTLSGEFLSDQHLKEIALCHDLECFSFEAPNVSLNALRRIGGLSNLSVLVLPKTRLDDQTVISWGPLRKLFELDLSHTKISERALSTLLQSNDLQKLLLNHTAVSRNSLQAIQGLPRLFRLELAGVGMDAESLAALLQQVKLDRLDLSESHLDEKQIEVLCSSAGEHLTSLILHQCDLAPADIQRIADAHPTVIIETSTAIVSASYPLVNR